MDGNRSTAVKRLRAGAYARGDYLIRYLAWLGEDWDGSKEDYRPWHVFRRASNIDNRMRLEALRTLDEAEEYVSTQMAADRSRNRP